MARRSRAQSRHAQRKTLAAQPQFLRSTHHRPHRFPAYLRRPPHRSLWPIAGVAQWRAYVSPHEPPLSRSRRTLQLWSILFSQRDRVEPPDELTPELEIDD